jgi:hypothetical protein
MKEAVSCQKQMFKLSILNSCFFRYNLPLGSKLCTLQDDTRKKRQSVLYGTCTRRLVFRGCQGGTPMNSKQGLNEPFIVSGVA